MRKFISILGIALSLLVGPVSAFAAIGHPSIPLPTIVKQNLNQSVGAGPLMSLGTQVTDKKLNVLKAVYDVAVLGGASGSSIVLKDANGGDAVLPKNAIVTSVYIQTLTAFASTPSTAQLSFGVNSVADLKAATAIASFSGVIAGEPVHTAASAVVANEYNKAIVAKSSVQALTAGKAVLYIEYYIGSQ